MVEKLKQLIFYYYVKHHIIVYELRQLWHDVYCQLISTVARRAAEFIALYRSMLLLRFQIYTKNIFTLTPVLQTLCNYCKNLCIAFVCSNRVIKIHLLFSGHDDIIHLPKWDFGNSIIQSSTPSLLLDDRWRLIIIIVHTDMTITVRPDSSLDSAYTTLFVCIRQFFYNYGKFARRSNSMHKRIHHSPIKLYLLLFTTG